MYRRKESLLEGGGKDRIDKQHADGKMTARERIDMLLDINSFVEIGAYMKHRSTDFGLGEAEIPGDGVVTGYGTIDNNLVYVYAQDFTVMGGSLGEVHAQKICKVMDMAIKTGAPIIGINDSGGARVQEGIDALGGFGEIFYRNTKASGIVPQISVIMGPCAGGAVYSPAITDFVFMVDNTSQMFITGPEVIKTVTGEEITKEELGGANVHASKSGVAHFHYTDEAECIREIRKLINYLPSNYLEEPVESNIEDDPNRKSSKLMDIMPDVPSKAYDMRLIIEEIIDTDSFIEVHKDYAQNIIVGFAKMNNDTVGIIANQPKILAGALDVNASDKAARFIRFCDSFNISIVTLTDVPGYFPGVAQEHTGIIRHGAKLLYAYCEATVPKINLILRKAYGGAYIAMSSKHLKADLVLAWPTAEIAVMGAQGAANIIFRKDIDNADNPEKMREQKVEQYKENFANPYVAANRGFVDAVIEPMMTRPYIISALQALKSKREEKSNKKHGNIPL
ncbi:methylmalonyl-CoA carboxyltransferase [Vallitalea guaymasensis]|uniref:Methylmalonyl-CoA carboxyltransferase n=2 Tax=Vallitalea guaymasensis TaxID=1185412 RepID=A0A8J8MFN9_9FIRM|nr:carboxyl transferase domain-containing protein [Vallitalea guaymasensis]QUH32061.1 methylmalonyl-CoA carboxyltransferase [Vallitalea guaymasensis]